MKKCAQRKIFAILPHILQISLKIDLKQYNLGKFSFFCMSFWARSLFLPHFQELWCLFEVFEGFDLSSFSQAFRAQGYNFQLFFSFSSNST